MDAHIGPRRLPFAPAARLAKVIALMIVVVALSIGANSLVHAIQPPGAAIRGELIAAAVELRTLSPTESGAAVRQSLLGYFSGQYSATVATPSYPARVMVILHGVDKNTCLGVMASAHRIEGLVVVQLEGYKAASDCRTENDMTWSLMP